MDPTHPFLQTDPDPVPFPVAYPQLTRLDRALLCPICKELFKAPVSIACGHSFCSACIRSFLDVAKKCPGCHEPAKEGAIRRNRALEEMADAWEAARPSLLDLARPPSQRKRARNSRSSSPPKRARKVLDGDGDDGDIEIVGRSSDDKDELSENDEAPCPLCEARMAIAAIPGHIERGCPPPKQRAGASGSGNQQADWKKVFAGASSSKSKTTDMKRIVKPNYSLTGLSDLRGLLSEHGLPTSGDRATLEARFQEWIVLFNANLDSSHPSSLPALRAQLASTEAARKRDKDKGRDAVAETLRTKEGFREHARGQQAEFERLRQEILDRRKKRQGAGVETAIEVE